MIGLLGGLTCGWRNAGGEKWVKKSLSIEIQLKHVVET